MYAHNIYHWPSTMARQGVWVAGAWLVAVEEVGMVPIDKSFSLHRHLLGGFIMTWRRDHSNTCL